MECLVLAQPSVDETPKEPLRSLLLVRRFGRQKVLPLPFAGEAVDSRLLRLLQRRREREGNPPRRLQRAVRVGLGAILFLRRRFSGGDGMMFRWNELSLFSPHLCGSPSDCVGEQLAQSSCWSLVPTSLGSGGWRLEFF